MWRHLASQMLTTISTITRLLVQGADKRASDKTGLTYFNLAFYEDFKSPNLELE